MSDQVKVFDTRRRTTINDVNNTSDWAKGFRMLKVAYEDAEQELIDLPAQHALEVAIKDKEIELLKEQIEFLKGLVWQQENL